MGNGHEPTIEAATLDISKMCRLGWGAGLPGEG